MNNTSVIAKNLVMLLPLWAIAVGCASGKNQIDEKLSSMEAEIRRIKAENANLAARNQALDDKVLLYEKKTDVEAQSALENRRLEVVRLEKPQSTVPGRDTVAEYREISLRENGDSKDDSKENKEEPENGPRPVLRLSGWSQGIGETRENVFTASARSASSTSDSAIPGTGRGDNLGVVSSSSRNLSSETNESPAVETDEMGNFNMAYRAYSNNNFEAALAGFSTFLKNNPNHDYADRAMYWRGECYLAQGKMLKAIGEFERLIKRFPDSEQAASALYRLGFVYDRMQDRIRAREYYFSVVELHPGTEAARKASRRITALESEKTQAATIAASAER